MLGAKMMYYPFVHPPRLVLWQALLYWDAVTSISPEHGYQLRRELEVLSDLGLYQPAHADDLPWRQRSDLVEDLRQVVERLPGEDLVPLPGPPGPDDRVYWGKLPGEVESDLVAIGALVPDADMLRASPVLLSRLMVVLARHLAAAMRETIPFTDSRSAYRVAFAPLGPDLAHRRCWQLQIGGFLPVPAPDTPLQRVLGFREAYAEEREELAGAVRKLLLSVHQPGAEASPRQETDEIEKSVKHIRKAVQELEKAGHSRGIPWVRRSVWVLGGLSAAVASTAVPPIYTALLAALSGLGVSVGTTITRQGTSTEYTYLQHLQAAFPDATWPSRPPTT